MPAPPSFRPQTRPLACAAICLILLLIAALPLHAKPASGASNPGPGSGSLEGRLTDTHSIPLEEAEILLRNLDNGATVHATTGKNGSYRFLGLSPGEYRLEATVPELGRGAVEGILVSAGHMSRVQAALRMELADPRQLETAINSLDPISPAVSTTISSEDLAALPIPTEDSGRDWQAMAATVPGSAPATEPAGSSHAEAISEAIEQLPDQGLALTGTGSELEAAAIDGMAELPAFQAHNGRDGQSPGPGSTSLGPSAIESVHAQIATDPAEDPGVSGVRYRTARGRNGLHGQGFFLGRESLWAARNPFTQWIQQTGPVNGVTIAQFTAEPWSPASSTQNFGLGAGSHLLRNRLWWFASLDGRLRSDPAVATVRHPDELFAQPTNDELQVFAARLDLPEPAILEEGAAAYSTGLAGLATLLGPVPRRANGWDGFGRIDWKATERQHLSARAGYGRHEAAAGGIRANSATYGSHSFGNSQSESLWEIAQWQSFLSANLLNSVSGEFRTHALSETPQTPSAFEAPLLANSLNQLPEMIVDSKCGLILGTPARLTSARYPFETTLLAQETVSWVHGRHLLRAGAGFDHAEDATHSLLNQAGTYDYTDVLNFLSDRASFLAYGLTAINNPNSEQHNCDATGRVHTAGSTLLGLGPLPCYAWFTQTVGPANWHVSANNLAGFVTDQWQPAHNLTISAGVRMEAEQLPPPIAFADNPALPQTEKLPDLGIAWAPRVGLAWQPHPGTVFRLGAGLYYGRVNNATLLAALTQTGSLAGDLKYFFKPTDAGAPPFPYAFSAAPAGAIEPGATAFAPNFKQQEIEQAVVSLEERLPGRWLLNVSAMASLGRRLPISIDTNLERAVDAKGNPQMITYNVEDSLKAGPITSATVTEPLYTERPDAQYQQISTVFSRANSTYEAATVRLLRSGPGLNMQAWYHYAHAMDWNPNEGSQLAGSDVLDPENLALEYGTSNLDIRSSAGLTLLYRVPWRLEGWGGMLANGWGAGGLGSFHSGLPYTMRVTGYTPGFYAGSKLIEGVGPGENGSAGDNRLYEIGRNTYRYPATWTGNLRLSRRIDLPDNWQLEFLAETFNLFNHQNVTLIETNGYSLYRGATDGSNATLNFMTGLDANGAPSLTTVEFGKPLNINSTDFFRPREIQLGLRAHF